MASTARDPGGRNHAERADFTAPVVHDGPMLAPACPPATTWPRLAGPEDSPAVPATSRSDAPVPGPEPVPRGAPERVRARDAAEVARRRAVWRQYQALRAAGVPASAAARTAGVSAATLSRWRRRVAAAGEAGLAPRPRPGRPVAYRPTEAEVAVAREIYARLDAGALGGPNGGSSRTAAWRLAAASEDPRVSEALRRWVGARRSRRLPESWLRLLDQTELVLRAVRQPGRTPALVTPRRLTWVDAAGRERVLEAGDVFEADDGTLNFYSWVPWPWGGDPCADRYGVRLGRWQLLPVVDVRSRCIIAFHVVARGKSSYRGEDVLALLGDTFRQVGMPRGALRLERGSWESRIVRDALELARVPVVNAWSARQKAAVENAFHRLWTPLSLVTGHAGRARGGFEAVTDLALKAQAGAVDPREHFESLGSVMPRLVQAVEFANGEPLESRAWGRWVPRELWAERLAAAPLERLDEGLSLFFAREQRRWTVRGGLVGGVVTGPWLRVPVYFQPPELAAYEGVRLRVYFDPYAEDVRGTLVLDEPWRDERPGQVVAREVPALELPPALVLAEEWGAASAAREHLAVRQAMARAVRTEAWTWLGRRTSTTDDGTGRRARVEGAREPVHGGRGEPGPGRRRETSLCDFAPGEGPGETHRLTPLPGALSRPTPGFVSAFEDALR